MIIKHGAEARACIKKGVDYVADVVAVTLGPRGRNVMIDSLTGLNVINDGVSIAKDINSKDINLISGIRVIKSVSSNADELAGDGTTTATILAQSMIHEGLSAVDKGAFPIQVSRGMDKAFDSVDAVLKDLSKSISITDKESIYHIALISSGYEKYARIITDAILKAGVHGNVTVDRSLNADTKIEVYSGLKIDRGILSKSFLPPDRPVVEYTNPLVILIQGKCTFTDKVKVVLQAINSKHNGRPVVIMAEDFDNMMLNFMFMNNVKGTMKITPVKTPHFGDKANDLLGDIAVVCSAKPKSCNEITEECIGSIPTFKSTEFYSLFGGYDYDTVPNMYDRVSSINKAKEYCNATYDIDFMQRRIDNLKGKMVSIKVGGDTDIEQNDAKLRIEDAINATKSALDSGILVGGGVAYLKAKKKLFNLMSESYGLFDKDEVIGAKIVHDSLSAPFARLVKNSGSSSWEVLESMIVNSDTQRGYDALLNTVVEVTDNFSIIDPYKVVRSSLLNAISVAKQVITTEVLVIEEEDI